MTEILLSARGAVEWRERLKGFLANPLCPSDISPYQGRIDTFER